MLLALLACAPLEGVPEFGPAPAFEVVANAASGLATPRDLAFHPVRDELWVANRADDSIVLVFDPTTERAVCEKRKDAFADHFMEEVSSLAFGDDAFFATCQESRNTYDGAAPGNDFMGPALWPSGLDEFAALHQADDLLGSHLDMLHQSPDCMGVAHERDNVYWVFDGANGHVVRYDFGVPHGYGEDDHSDGVVRRYPEVALSRVPDVPGHLEFFDEHVLLVANTGEGTVDALDIRSGRITGELDPSNEPLAEFSVVTDVVWAPVLEGFSRPSGLLVHDERIFVSDEATGEIAAFDHKGRELDRISVPGGAGVMGLAIGPDGRLYYADGRHDEVVRVVP
jgi:DNA-binding beta-propeller fold protein YncE